MLKVVIEIILSIVTISISIYIPTTIAKKQNKIAIFEKRYECYNHILEHIKYSYKDHITIDNLFLNGTGMTRRCVNVNKMAEIMTRSRLLFPEQLSKEIDDLFLSFQSVNFLDQQLENELSVLNHNEYQNLQKLIKNKDFDNEDIKNILGKKVHFSKNNKPVYETLVSLIEYENNLIFENKKNSKDLLKELEKEIALKKIKQF